MNEKNAKTDYKQVILNQVRHPLKLRLLLCGAIITGWYVLFFSPLSEETVATTAKIVSERKRVAGSRQIEQLKKALAPYKGRVPAEAGLNELMQYVIARMRSSPLKLLDLKPEKSKDLGPYEALGLKLTLEGRFAEFDEFLNWVETDERLLRIDAIKLDPVTNDPGRLAAQVVLLSLGEKSAPVAKTKMDMAKNQHEAGRNDQGTPATVKAKTEVAKKQDGAVRKGKGSLATVKAKTEVAKKP
jgi:Tfp pilus assembly protein PilO